jgi:Domain of unknown function (DUF309)
MSKGERIEAYVQSMGFEGQNYDPCYLAYFACFNTQEYYEAHDVLEHLWLKGANENYAFFKGLIQFAGAFVHLKKQREHPTHAKHGRRLHPAVRLFAMAGRNLTPYGPVHLGLDITLVLDISSRHVAHIVESDFSDNPWHPERAPHLSLAGS